MPYYHDQLQEKYLSEARDDIVSDIDYGLEIAITALDAKATRELTILKARALAEDRPKDLAALSNWSAR